MTLAPLLLASLLWTTNDAAHALSVAEDFVRDCTPREAGTIRGHLAASWLLDRASAAGANVKRDMFVVDTPEGKRRFTNLYATFASNPTNRYVVLLSHYDTKGDCPGANDGASTSALLVAFADLLSRTPRAERGNVILMWLDGEECLGGGYAPNDGLQGSRRAVRFLRENKVPVQAVLCLDMLGDRDLKITIPANGTKTLARIACHAARRVGDADLVACADFHLTDDHVPFLEAGYSAIDLIDFSYGPNHSFWHTNEDTCDKLSEASLFRSGRLVCEILNLLR